MVDKKISKTARASLGQKGEKGSARHCPECGNELVATKIVRGNGIRGGMYWVCDNGDFRARIR